jgi:DNA polymerase-1
LQVVGAALNESKVVGLDLETTGLDPGKDRVRLLSLSCETNDGGRFSYLIDCFSQDPAPLWDALAGLQLVIHHAAFDLAFLARLGFTLTGRVHDTMLLAQLLAAGTEDRCRLEDCCERYLRRPLDKTAQRSDWTGGLTDDQLAYAALDAEVLAPLHEALTLQIEKAGLARVAEIEERCLPALVWMGRHGVPFDRDAWSSLARAAEEEAEALREELDRTAPPRPAAVGELCRWNWNSPQQVKQALALAGCEVESTADSVLAAAGHPLAALIRRHRDARKRCTTYGSLWLKHVAPDGRVYPTWMQLGAASGRTSCSGPNMQQMPRGEYRRCVAAPPGRVLVKADYSQVELRIAAKVSGDQALLDAYQRGDDLHARTARSVLGIEEVSKKDRQLAKALNFGLLYGMGARGFREYASSQYGLELTGGDAGRYRDAFFMHHPGLAAWHRRVRSRPATQTRTLTGRRRLLPQGTPDTVRLNTPIQGSGADGLKLALALLWERRDACPGAVPVLAVHDEIVVEADAGQAETAAAWVRQAMEDGMAPLIDPVPVVVDVAISQTWAGE